VRDLDQTGAERVLPVVNRGQWLRHAAIAAA
jgi:hypothetical protein